MAQAKCVVADLRAVGGLAREFESVSTAATKEVAGASGAANGARAGAMQSVRALNDLDLYWSGIFGVQGVDLRTVGEELVSTANVFAHGDRTGADEFRHAAQRTQTRVVRAS